MFELHERFFDSAEANQASLDSAAHVQLRVVGRVFPDTLPANQRFRETGSFERDLDLFRNDNDETLNEIHQRRASTDADVAVLVVATVNPARWPGVGMLECSSHSPTRPPRGKEYRMNRLIQIAALSIASPTGTA